MGTCSAKKTQQQNFSLTPISKFSSNPLILEKITSKSENYIKQVKNSQQFKEVREYDHQNPHRQFNVRLNGVDFEVINSIEEGIFVQFEENKQISNISSY